MGFEVPKVSLGMGGVSPYEGGGGARHIGGGGPQEFRDAPEKSQLVARLDAIDARDIGLNGDRSGFQGQKNLNYIY